MDLHALGIEDIVARIQEEDAAVLEAMRQARAALAALIRDAEAGFVAGGRLIYVGAGTSGRLGVLDASEAPPTFLVPRDKVIGIIAGGDGALRRSSEGAEDDPRGAEAELARLELGVNDTLIGIAAGGTTPYVLGALAYAKSIGRGGPLTALLTCADVARPAHADHLIVLRTGPEVITGSTRMKAGTATKLALNTISTTLMVRAGKVYENLMVDVRASNDKLKDRAARIVATLTGLEREAAFALLERAAWSVKAAVVMEWLGVGQAEAERRLEAARGRLGEVLK